MNINKYWNSDRDDISDRPEILFQEEHLSYIDDCEKIIDLGCGTGQLVSKLRDNGKCAYGITYNKTEVDIAITDGIIFGDMHEIPFLDGTFDAFIMWDTLEHCQSAYIALCEAKRVLRNKGKGLIFMPGQNWLNCHCHICCYTVPQMEQLLRQAELKIINIYEKKYPGKPEIYCEGMAIYEIEKDNGYITTFEK